MPASTVLSAWLSADLTQVAPTSQRKDVLKGFIVSDSHFGWSHPQQPTPEEIRRAMARIMNRFPDLDVFIDTGDAHHAGVADHHRGRWTEIIPGGCGPIPFFYTPGNHEIDAWGECKCDIEWRANCLGSLTCRPYYSFDLLGIHFVALPELLFMCLVTDEALDWLKLDFAIHQDKSVILLSHNSLAGTTGFQDDPGYRRVANSRAVIDVITRHPNVLAWMHGHNHTYEMVQKYGKLFVSNGRIGGFIPEDPKWAGRHQGGIYFEVGANHLTARAYSATDDRPLDELGYPHLHQTLRVRTSFDPTASPAICYGVGNAKDGERIPAVLHHVSGTGGRELFITGSAGASFNENADLSIYTERTNAAAPDKKILPGHMIEPHEDFRWEWCNPGVRIARRPDAGDATTLVTPGRRRGISSYYACAPGKTYRVVVDLESPQGGQALQLRCRVHDRRMQQVISIDGPVRMLAAGSSTVQTDFALPPLSEVTSIYTDPASDNLFHLWIEARFTQLYNDVVVRRIVLKRADATETTLDPAVLVDGARFAHSGELASGRVVRFEVPGRPTARSVCEVSAAGNRRLTWLIRQAGLRWQVRNAPVLDTGEYLEVGPLRNAYGPRKEIVIAPMTAIDVPHVYRSRNVNRARIYPWKESERELAFEVVDLLGPARIDVRASAKPSEVLFADAWTHAKDDLVLDIRRTGTVRIRF